MYARWLNWGRGVDGVHSVTTAILGLVMRDGVGRVMAICLLNVAWLVVGCMVGESTDV